VGRPLPRRGFVSRCLYNGGARRASTKEVTIAARTTLDFTTAQATTFYKTVTVQAGN
jgi:hypothetical protein